MGAYLWVGVVFFLAGFNQGLSGFGVILLAIPLLSLVLNIKTVIPLTALSALAISIMLLIQLKEKFEFRNIASLLAGALPGVPVGAVILKNADKIAIQWALGLILILYSLYGLFAKRSTGGIHPRWAYPFGFISGAMAGVLSAAAPPIVVYMTLQSWEKDKIKASLQGFFIVSGTVVAVVHALTGLTTSYTLKLFAFSAPPLLLGTYLGSLLYGRLNEGQYRKVMLVFLAFLGFFIIWRA